MNIDDLDDKFGIEGEIGFYQEEEMAYAMVSNKYADATICLHGAQILNYSPAKNMEVLWMSPDSKFEQGKAIRGGIPVCFPWFGPHKTDTSLPQHGFARIMNWEIIKTETLDSGENLICLQLNSSDKTKGFWPHDFCAEMIFKVGPKLSITLKVNNSSANTIEYTCALHSYLSVSGIENIAIKGLSNTRYQNQLDGGDYKQEEEVLTVNKATTRHYYNTESTCIIVDPIFNRGISIEKTGSKNTTVWNPWAETCAEMGDMPNDGYETFVCLETVNKIEDVITLTPGESHETTATIGVI